mgnify:CR=1 FL=1|tara:strand:+ start:365 stop:691 length:327 start_codon:yes stop_codon:yes gene_type:complete
MKDLTKENFKKDTWFIDVDGSCFKLIKMWGNHTFQVECFQANGYFNEEIWYLNEDNLVTTEDPTDVNITGEWVVYCRETTATEMIKRLKKAELFIASIIDGTRTEVLQ